ncbi:hypothetical protein N9934_01900 [Desulfosarcina sp.]|nr:hypothetical protein [Desulfosarcina sp.]
MTDNNSNTPLAETQSIDPNTIVSGSDAAAEPVPLEPDNAPIDRPGDRATSDPALTSASAAARLELPAPEPAAQAPSDDFSTNTEDAASEAAVEVEPKPDQADDTGEKDPMLAGKKSRADIAVALMNKSSSFFHTLGKEPYAMIWKQDHYEVWSIHSKEFELWIRYLYYQHTQSAMKKSDLLTAIQEAEASALFAGPEMEVWLRIAKHEGAFYIDIGNANWEQIEITPDSWRVISLEKSPVRFRRPKGMRSLPHPEPDGDLKRIGSLLNLRNDGDLCLILSWMVGAMHPTGPYPILIIQGEQGTGKSFLTKCIRSLLDPSTVPNRTLPRTERDLAISAEAARILCYDNVSGIKDAMSDAFCRIATGGGFGTRTLYTDKSEELFNSTRPMIFNGISDLVVKHDFADRALVVTLQPIPAENRRSESDIRINWEAIRPSAFGALCNAVVEALRNHENVQLDRSPRMADFAKWLVAAEPALPWGQGHFMTEYEKNRFELIEVAIESDPISLSVMEMMNRLEGNEWKGTPTKLLKALASYAPDGTNKKGWPQAPNIFTNRLRRSQTILRAKGVDVEHSKSGNRSITLKMRSQGA